VTNKSMCMLLF